MTFKSYLIYDRVTEEFSFPFFQKNDVLAKRQFDKFLDGVEEVQKNDFTLVCNGTFNNETADYTNDYYDVTENKVLDAE